MTLPTTLKYRRLVQVGLASNAINLSSAAAMGHRVHVTMPVDELNSFFNWQRAEGSARATGHFNSAGFVDSMNTTLAGIYSDLDSVYTGLSFSSASLDSATDPRLRNGGEDSANDLVVAYVLFKCFGSTAATTLDVVYNLEDAMNMVSNNTVSSAINDALASDEAAATPTAPGFIDTMFTNLMASQPMRFFDASGKQMAGLFETNADAASSGSWNLIQSDIIEIPIQFTFTEPVTLNSAIDTAGELSGNTDPSVIIHAGDSFCVRLQIVAGPPSGSGGSGSGGTPNPTVTSISTAFSAGQVVSTWAATDATSYSITFYENSTNDKISGTAIDTQVLSGKTATCSTIPSEGLYYYSIVTPINGSTTGKSTVSLTTLFSMFPYVSTFAGSETPGWLDGVGAEAQFNQPFGSAMDSQGNMYVTDALNHCVRKITPNGTVTTVAGIPGASGYADGPAASALFNVPTGLALDSARNLYICDALNNMIRKLTPSGVVSTVCGGLSNPVFCTMNPSDQTKLYVSNQVEYNVVSVDIATGALTVLVDGFMPMGIAYYAGHLYVVQLLVNGALATGINKISLPSGANPAVSTPISLSSPLATAFGITIMSDGTMYVVDTASNSIKKVLQDGTVTLHAGSGVPGNLDGGGGTAQFNSPCNIIQDSTGNMYVTGYLGPNIRKIWKTMPSF